MPRTKLRAVLVAGFFLLIVAVALSIQQLYFMSMAMFMLPVVSFAFGWRAVRGLTAARTGPAVAEVGEELEFTLRVANHGSLRRCFVWVHDPLPAGLQHVEDHQEEEAPPALGVAALEPVLKPARGARLVPGVGPGEEIEVRYTALARRRGRHVIPPTELMASDPLGIFPRRCSVGDATAVRVYPRPVPLPRFVLGVGAYDAMATSRPELPGEGQEFRALRDYVPGDDLRRVHWKTSARRGKLTVVEFDQARAVHLHIVLDLHPEALVGDADDSTIETAVTVAASLAQHTLDGGGTVRLTARGKEDYSLDAVASPEEFTEVLEALALAEPGGDLHVHEVVTAELGRLRPGTCVAVISPVTGSELIDTVARLRGAGCRPVNVVLRADMYLAPDDRRALESGLGQAYSSFTKQLAGAGSRVFQIGAGEDIGARMGVPRVAAS